MNAAGRQGATALLLAAAAQPAGTDAAAAVETVELLLRRGADTESADSRGRRPLHASALAGADRLVEMLLAAGANPTARDSQDQQPADLAPAQVPPPLAAAVQSFHLHLPCAVRAALPGKFETPDASDGYTLWSARAAVCWLLLGVHLAVQEGACIGQTAQSDFIWKKMPRSFALKSPAAATHSWFAGTGCGA